MTENEVEKVVNEAIRSLYRKDGYVSKRKIKKFGIDDEAINWGDLCPHFQEYIKNYVKEKAGIIVAVITEW